MTTPLTASTVQLTGTTPVQIAAWQRGDSAFAVLVRVDAGGSANAYITRNPTGTIADAFPVSPGDIIGFDVPAKASAYAPTPPPEYLYAFAAFGTATVSVLVEPR